LADVANFLSLQYINAMPETLNISLAPGQLAWLKARKEQEGFATASDVVRDLIRRQQERERAALDAAFEKLENDGAPGAEPVDQIMKVVSRVKKERREANRRS
jgi:Arc/MetJ-type ribon-helix-helix transcriptional regulator